MAKEAIAIASSNAGTKMYKEWFGKDAENNDETIAKLAEANKLKEVIKAHVQREGLKIGISDLNLQHLMTMPTNVERAERRHYWNEVKSTWHTQIKGKPFPVWLDNLFDQGTAADFQWPNGSKLTPEAKKQATFRDGGKQTRKDW
jgi:hypothetical protein